METTTLLDECVRQTADAFVASLYLPADEREQLWPLVWALLREQRVELREQLVRSGYVPPDVVV
jgi:hypothetical protein